MTAAAPNPAGVSVRFLGWRKDILTLMRASDAFLFPSSAEGLPGVVMEAMYCGTPVVTTDMRDRAANALAAERSA